MASPEQQPSNPAPPPRAAARAAPGVPDAQGRQRPASELRVPATRPRSLVKAKDQPLGVAASVMLFLLGSNPGSDKRARRPAQTTTAAGRPPRPACPHPRARWLPVVFVGAVWVLALIGAAVKGYYGVKTPTTDDWEIVKAVDQPLSWEWLWEQHGAGGNHRIPLPKLVLRSLYQLSGYDCRWGIWLNALALGGTALALMWAARQLRGRTTYADAIFPLVLLNWLSAPLWWGFHFQFLSSTVLACILLVVMVHYGSHLPAGAALLAGLCLVALPLCGANGLALVPALAVWLACAGLGAWYAPSPRGKARGVWMLASVLAGALLIALYLRGYQAQENATTSRSLRTTARAAADFLSVNFAGLFLDYHLPEWLQPGRYLEVGLLLVSLPVLLYTWRKRPGRSRAFGLLLFFGAFFCLADALALGRGADWSDFHYRILATPVLFAVYFVWVGAGGRFLPRLVQNGLLLTALVTFPLTVWNNLPVVTAQWERQRAFDQDILAGVPPCVLVDQYSDIMDYCDVGDNGPVAGYLLKLRDARMGVFRYLPNDPIYQEVPIPGTAGRDAADPLLVTYSPDKPQRVYGVRLKYPFAQPAPSGPAQFKLKVTWVGNGQEAASGAGRSRDIAWEGNVAGSQKNLAVWINEEVSTITIIQELKPEFAGDPEVVLLVPPAAAP